MSQGLFWWILSLEPLIQQEAHFMDDFSGLTTLFVVNLVQVDS